MAVTFNEIVERLYDIDFTFNESFWLTVMSLENKQFKTLNFLITYAKYAGYVSFIQGAYRSIVSH